MDGFLALYVFMLAAFTGYEIIGRVPVILHTPLMSETRHLIGERQFRLMKPGSFLINVSRGPVVDEVALIPVFATLTIYRLFSTARTTPIRKC